jgi:2-polyprenyl-3-methyl-5-hydroxy-6-metoxy-1,4-benzoquinol methylase
MRRVDCQSGFTGKADTALADGRISGSPDLPDGETAGRRRPGMGADAGRFGFGANWERFARTLGEAQVEAARRSLADMLGDAAVEGKTFLDVGSGSGLFSLAALQLGASRVHSFDYDADSVRTTQLLKKRYALQSAWAIEQGSALDEEFMRRLGTFDLVYSWGVLHHTGDMWRAFELTTRAVAPGGTLFVSIYNDQGKRSRRWRAVKRTYNRLPRQLAAIYAALVVLPGELRSLAGHLVRGRPGAYLATWRRENRARGMSRWHDILDWVGGYPFEVARPEEVFDFCAARGFRLTRVFTCGGGPGCNQFVFLRDAEAAFGEWDGRGRGHQG